MKKTRVRKSVYFTQYVFSEEAACLRVLYLVNVRNEVGARLCFYTCLILFTVGGVCPISIHAPPPPGTRGRHPQEQTSPGADSHPGPGTLPPAQCMLEDTGHKRAVRFLLECNLVLCDVFFILKSPVTGTYIGGGGQILTLTTQHS